MMTILAGALATTCLSQDVAAPAKTNVACVGDSITAGGYPAALGRLLGDGYDVANFSSNGRAVTAKDTYPSLLEDAGKFAPQIVLLQLGTNNATPEAWKSWYTFLQDYKDLVEAFQNLSSKPRIYVLLPPPVFKDGGYDIDGRVLRTEVTPLIIKAARECKVETVDLYKPLADCAAFFPDNVHPNSKGDDLIARQVCQRLTGRPVQVPQQSPAREPAPPPLRVEAGAKGS